MLYPLLILAELILLWRLSSYLTSRLYSTLPTFIYVIFFLPGTFVHELAHYLAAKLLGVGVGKFNLMPEKREKEIVLGSVAIAKTDQIRRFLIGIAPLILGSLLLYFLMYLTAGYQLFRDWRVAILLCYLVFIVANTMFSSKKDLEGVKIIIIAICLLVIPGYFLGARVHVSSQALESISLYLWVPIVLNGALLLIFRR